MNLSKTFSSEPSTATSPAKPPRSFAALLRMMALSVAVSAGLSAAVAWAQGDEYAEVNRLLRAGQLTDAQGKADQFLADKPRDPQMRFIKGVIQSENGKPAEAIDTFSKLTEDFPELPEPYNNLAVLYAGQSQFDKARVALEMAIRTNPGYAIAHENLGDIYAKLASQAYSKALQLDARNATVSPKLNLIRNLFSPEAKGVKSSAAAAPASATAAASGAQSDVETAVHAWAKAWSAKNMSGYLGAYAANFTPPRGQSRKDWEADRKARILSRNMINVGVSDLSVSVSGNRASARFRQAYASDARSVSGNKTLDFVKNGNRWLIVRESMGS